MLDRLTPQPGSRRPKRRPRGTGCGFGKTAGRGTKGQGKRTSGRETPRHFEGGQMPLARRLRKFGFRRPQKVACEIVNVGALGAFGDGATVDPESLVRRGLIRGQGAPVKVLGEGEVPRNLVVRAHRVSTGARGKIEAAGGKVEILE